jgi:ADP-heptose:LPS heptosyltransferase
MAKPIAMLRNRFPLVEIILVTGSSNRGAAQFLPNVDKFVTVSVIDVIGTARRLRRLNADVLLDFGPWPRLNAIVAAFSGARFVAGFATAGQHRHYCQDVSVAHRSDVHEEENQTALVAVTGSLPIGRPPLVMPQAKPIQQPLPTRYVVFHPWAGGTAAHLKAWTIRGWEEVSRWALKRELAVVVTGGPADLKKSLEFRVLLQAAAPGLDVRSLAGTCDLATTAGVLKGAIAVVAVDTGIMHLSGLLGCPTVCLHGPTTAKRWGALGPNVIPIEPDSPDCGYLNLGFEVPKLPPQCMERITSDMVEAALERLTKM